MAPITSLMFFLNCKSLPQHYQNNSLKKNVHLKLIIFGLKQSKTIFQGKFVLLVALVGFLVLKGRVNKTNIKKRRRPKR